MDKSHNGYTRLGQIGEGTFCKTYLAVKEGVRFAMKIQRKSMYESTHSVYRQEMQKEINFFHPKKDPKNPFRKHPNLINYIESFTIRDPSTGFDRMCIILEYADGLTLQSKYKEKIPEQQALLWFYQACMGLSYLHKEGIGHRDVKPANILIVGSEISGGGIAKIADFGTTKQLEPMREHTIPVGTETYFSPERSTGVYNEKVDVWAMGIILFEMQTGGLRPLDKEQDSLIKQLPQYLSEEYKTLILSLLQKDPDNRPSIQEVLSMPIIKKTVAESQQKKKVEEQIKIKETDQKEEERVSEKGYRIISKLGSGSIAKVYLVEQLSTHKLYALKKQKNHHYFVLRYQATQQFQTEVEFLRKFQHPFIINCIESFRDESGISLVLENSNGDNLLTRTKDQPIPEKMALNWVAQICLALAKMHVERIAHRNLSLPNIIIKGEKVKVSDFQSTKKIYELENQTIYCGALRYFAPEKYTDEYDEKVDVWSTGVMLYEMLTGGQHPFSIDFKMKYPREYPKQLPILELRQMPSSISQPCQDLIKSMLQKDPELRPSVFQLLEVPIIFAKIKLIVVEQIYGEEIAMIIKRQLIQLKIAVPTD
ncbi:hypothetical protein FGO68_gene12327 [Halteria grandinella]|uniref:Protein kinase domain-containing protein n=1 Tax=Halteria grandinella TaxID=5974 RepID=A0A8J8T6M5_HALGN|nr:hypothetical protein FGO68_gene12327 [Halteria grandinella]